MERCEYPGCRKCGQRHHIVFRSQGGLDINVNFKYLCAEHHTGTAAAVHNNRAFDIELKKEMQNKLENMLEDEMTIERIAGIIGYNKNRLAKRFKTVPSRAGIFKKEDVLRKLMGDRLY